MRIEELKTPCYVIDEKQLKKNLSILQKVEKDTGCKILLAQKAFSCFYEYPLIGQYLSGTTASGLFEARLGKEEMGKENHVFAPAYKEEDVKELVKICDGLCQYCDFDDLFAIPWIRSWLFAVWIPFNRLYEVMMDNGCASRTAISNPFR